MGLYNFQKRFKKHIRSGRKRHTIRAKRKHPAKPGETLYLYTGLRTKKAKRIIKPPICSKVEDVTICTNRTPLSDEAIDRFEVFVDGVALGQDEKERLAYIDGFDSFADMMKFWTGRLPFNGDIVHWTASEKTNRRKKQAITKNHPGCPYPPGDCVCPMSKTRTAAEGFHG